MAADPVDDEQSGAWGELGRMPDPQQRRQSRRPTSWRMRTAEEEQRELEAARTRAGFGAVTLPEAIPPPVPSPQTQGTGWGLAGLGFDREPYRGAWRAGGAWARHNAQGHVLHILHAMPLAGAYADQALARHRLDGHSVADREALRLGVVAAWVAGYAHITAIMESQMRIRFPERFHRAR